MTDYDSMSVHELVMEIYYAGAEIKSDVRQMCEDALRKAAVREASVGVITFDSAIPEPIYEMSLDLDGDYDLIPLKETP